MRLPIPCPAGLDAGRTEPSESDLEADLADVSLRGTSRNRFSGGVRPGVNVIRHDTDERLRIPIHPGGHVLLDAAADVAVGEVDRRVAGRELEYAIAAV